MLNLDAFSVGDADCNIIQQIHRMGYFFVALLMKKGGAVR